MKFRGNAQNLDIDFGYIDSFLSYVRSIGTITFSGGEPLYQSEFIFSCIEKLKGKLHTAIQTSGFCDIATILSMFSIPF